MAANWVLWGTDPQTVVSATEQGLISCLECPLGDRPSLSRRSRYLQDEQCVNYSMDGQIYAIFGSAAELLIMSQEEAPCKPQTNGTSRGPSWQNNVIPCIFCRRWRGQWGWIHRGGEQYSTTIYLFPLFSKIKTKPCSLSQGDQIPSPPLEMAYFIKMHPLHHFLLISESFTAFLYF